MYDPQNKRFMAQDIFEGSEENPQTFNRYPYVLNNPKSYIDPTGEKLFDWIIDFWDKLTGSTKTAQELQQELQKDSGFNDSVITEIIETTAGITNAINDPFNPDNFDSIMATAEKANALDAFAKRMQKRAHQILGPLENVPIVNYVAAPTNAMVYLAEEDYVETVGSLLGMIPVPMSNKASIIFTTAKKGVRKGLKTSEGPGGTGPIPVQSKTTASNGLEYKSNPKHTPGQPGYRSNAGIEPHNSLDMFNESIPSTTKPNQRYAYDKNTKTLHRFYNDGNGEWHWSGSTNQGANSLRGNEVPNDIKNSFGLPKKGW